MEGWVCLLLLLHCTAVTVSQNCTQEGAVEIIGTVTPTLIAGRLEICYNGLWRAVYDRSWNQAEPNIVCAQFGFPVDGASGCQASCYGASTLSSGLDNFIFCGNSESLLECGTELIEEQRPNNNAGVVCTRPALTSPTSATESNCNTDLPTQNTPATPSQCNCSSTFTPTNGIVTPFESTATPTSSTATPTSSTVTPTSSTVTPTELGRPATTLAMVSVLESESVSTNSTIAIIFGVVSAILLLTLVGVVLGWVWFCHKIRSVQRFMKEPHQMELNPSYTTPFTLSTTIQTQPNQCYKKTTPTPLYESVITDRENRN